MQKSLRGFVVMGIAGAFGQITSISNAADAPSPGQGNPFDSLPRLEPAPAPAVTVDIQKQPTDPAVLRLLASRIVPAKFQIAGVKTLPFDTVAAQFSPLTNREVTVADLLQAAANVTRLYQEKGYPLSFAFIPAQTFQDNIVVVNVVEGYVDTVKIEGNPGASEERLRDIAEQLKDDRPLSSKTFERVTRILGLQPGMRVSATVHPPLNTDGAAEMILDVKRRPLTAGMALDSAASGVRAILSATENGLTPLGEQITVSTLQPRGPSHEEYYGVSYAQPLGQRGLLLQANLSDYKGEPENQALTPLQFQARYQTQTRRVGAGLSYPLILDNRRSLTVSGGAYAVDNTQRFFRSVPATVPVIESTADIRAVNLGLSWSELAETSATQLSAALYRGFDTAGAKVVNSDAELNFTRVRTDFSRTQSLPGQFGVTFSGSGQYSGDILPTSEQIGFGSRLFGLAYPPGEIAGDKGWGLALEFSYAHPIDYAYLKQVQPYLMTDSARVYSNGGSLTHSKIASVGSGLRFTDRQHYALDLSLAYPIGEKPVNADNRALRLNLSYSYHLD
jgi:hemolysin activation/secretion protein